MCYKKPGPRCSGHAKVEYEKAKETLAMIRDAHINSPSDVSAGRLEVARQEFYNACVEYCTTPRGYQEFIARAQSNEKQGKGGEFHEKIAETGMAIRLEQLAKLNINHQRPMVGGVTTSEHNAIKGARIHIGAHALKQGLLKGIHPAEIESAFLKPTKVYENKKYPNQWRVIGGGICLTGEVKNGDFVVRTLYFDAIRTKPREDQLQTAEGREYARRFANNDLGDTRNSVSR